MTNQTRNVQGTGAAVFPGWRSLKLTVIAICLLSLVFTEGRAQDSPFLPRDPDSTKTAVADTTLADSSRTPGPFLSTSPQDSAASKKPSLPNADVGFDAEVQYSARSIESLKDKNIIYLVGDAQVKYKEITIKAGKITIKQDENLLVAEGIPDTSNGVANGVDLPHSDSLKVKYKDFPVFSDGKETMYGEEMEFNFKSQKGRIVRGRTEFQKGYYMGDAVKRVDDQVFYVANGSYSSCDKEEPHFHFGGKKMKVIVNDKVLAKPVIFYLGKIPLAIFPFAMFPAQESGRQSGVIIPQYGSSPTEGRYLRNLGYYWATNDYMDMQFTMDFFERSGFLFHGDFNYALRYNFTGSLSGSFTNKSFGESGERSWNLNVRHNHTIDANTSFNVNGSFQSSNNFYKDFSNNREERLRRQIISNATFNKRWGDGKNSLVMNLSQTKDLESGTESLTLPRVSYSHSRSAIFPVQENKRGAQPEPSWYNLIQYDYRAQLENSIRSDTTSTPDVVTRNVQHDVGLSYTNPGKLLGAFSLTQSVSYNEDWFDRRAARYVISDSSRNRLEAVEERGFFQRRTFNYSASTNTNLYGTFYPGIFAITALRHKMSPSVSFTYQPDFSADKWGYFVTATDTARNEVRFDRYSGTPRGEQMSMNFSLSNLFQMKVGKGEREKKFDLFNLNFSSGYNFAADSLKLRNLSTSFRANPRQNLNINMNFSHSFYRYNQATNRAVDEFISPRLTSFSIDALWRLSGKKAGETGKTATAAADTLAPEYLQPNQPSASGRYESTFAPESAFSALDIPWRAEFSFVYRINKTNPFNTSKDAYFDLRNVELQLTRNWRIGYSLRYDLEEREIVDQRISFYRDLHCWEARFDWNPSGIGKGYYFIVNVKAPHLKSLKFENRGGTTSVLQSPF